MQFDVAKLFQTAATVADALLGDEDITIRHSGLVVKAPYAGNEERTVLEVIQLYGGKIGISAGVRPSVTRTGQGEVDIEQPVQPGVYEAFTDKKENA